MIRPVLVQMNLSSAYLCPDISCNTVSNNSEQCPRCLALNVLSLSAILNRPEEPEPENEQPVTH